MRSETCFDGVLSEKDFHDQNQFHNHFIQINLMENSMMLMLHDTLNYILNINSTRPNYVVVIKKWTKSSNLFLISWKVCGKVEYKLMQLKWLWWNKSYSGDKRHSNIRALHTGCYTQEKWTFFRENI
jgi:hypothetical protein